MRKANSEKFSYDEDLLKSCGDELMVHVESENNWQYDLGTCRALFKLHSVHYGYNNEDNMEMRYEPFLDSVARVYEHMYKKSSTTFQLELNKFSHLHEHEIQAMLGTDFGAIPSSQSEEINFDQASNGDDLSDLSIDAFYDWESFYSSFEGSVKDYKSNFEHTRKKLSKLVKEMKKKINKTRKESDEKFHNHLNWATNNNPDGMPIVHSPSSQGNCGSCWAYSATGTVEASAMRNAAFSVYTECVIESSRSGLIDFTNSTEVNQILTSCRESSLYVEKKTFDLASLSVQELLDCDNTYDRGCVGGNPILAYKFITENGLTTNDNYPYVQKEQECQFNKVNQVAVELSSFSVLPSNAENVLAHVLRSLGPVAVGFSADMSFVAYKEGIYNSSSCSQDLNHALLIVGYGEEIIANETKSFWIARNSWSTAWGEGGFARIARNNDKNSFDTGTSVCGIALTPSLALGAYFVPELIDLAAISKEFKFTNLESRNIQANNFFGSTEYEIALFGGMFFLILIYLIYAYFCKCCAEKEHQKDDEAQSLFTSNVTYGTASDEFLNPKD